MQKSTGQQRLAFRAVNAALCGRAMRARLFALSISRSEEASAVSAGSWQDVPPGS
jgi:hypothetical protein